MRVHSILFVEARKALATAGGVTIRSRHGVLPRPTNEWNARGAAHRSHAANVGFSRQHISASPTGETWCIALKIQAQHQTAFPRLPEFDWASGSTHSGAPGTNASSCRTNRRSPEKNERTTAARKNLPCQLPTQLPHPSLGQKLLISLTDI